MRIGQSFGFAQATLLLGALSASDMPGPRRTVQEFTCSGHFEALGYGLFGLLHEMSGPKQ